jgi:hypothetical protein
MTDTEFRDWLEAEVLAGRMTQAQRDDLLEQKQYFERNRNEIEQQHPQRVVGYVNGRREVSASIQELLAQVQRGYPNRMVYFEPVGFDLC